MIRPLVSGNTFSPRSYIITSARKRKLKYTVTLIVTIMLMIYMFRTYSDRNFFGNYDLIPNMSASADGSTIGTQSTISTLGSESAGSGSTISNPHIKGVDIFQDVCLELHSDSQKTRIVVYNSEENKSKTIWVAGSSKKSDPKWHLEFKKGDIPSTNSILDGVAYFAWTTWPGNLYHFWTDLAMGLYGILKSTKRLKAQTPNYLFYGENLREKGPYHLQYQDIIFSLGFDRSHSGYGEAKPNTCFRNAVFGSYVMTNMVPGEAAKYVVDSMGISKEICDGPRLTIENRTSNRRILNVQELKEAAEEIGFASDKVDIVSFEKLDLHTQIRTAWCSTILTGVHGAGLTWMYFMQGPAAVLEIVWYQWSSFYKKLAKEERMLAETLFTRNHTVNWDDYAKIMNMSSINTAARAQFTKASSKFTNLSDNRNVYKRVDVYIDIKEFKKLVKRLTELLKKQL